MKDRLDAMTVALSNKTFVHRLVASVAGVSLVAGITVVGVMTQPHRDGISGHSTNVGRTVAVGASRSYDRESLLKESVSTDATGTWSLGVTEAEVKRNLDAQTKSNDEASKARDELKKALDEIKSLDTASMTESSVDALKKAMDSASKTLEGKSLRKTSEYDAVRDALRKAVDGLEKTPVVEAPSQSQSSTAGASGGNETSSTGSLSKTVPANEMQKWFHDHLLSNGYSESDFTAATYIITRESGWNPQAVNPSSGATGLPQALPGSKMASHGADWQTNYQTQLRWFVDYCNGRYGSIQGAYNYWLQNHCY